MGSALSTSDLPASAPALVAVGTIVVVQLLTPSNPIGGSIRLLKQFRSQEKSLTSAQNVSKSIDEYNRLHSSDTPAERNREYKSLVNSYYDLATLFYEWGWGKSFHFANRYPTESFDESIRRHEYYLASKLGLCMSKEGKTANMKLVDVGCGIGGPMRNICRFTGADVTGITLNAYQVQRGNELCESEFGKGHSNKDSNNQLPCRSVQGDFMHMPLEDNSFDGAYAIEATCHAPDRVGVYKEIFRVLRPGSFFACYEWCMTDGYDSTNADHNRIKKQIEEGDGLPDICHTSVCLQALKDAGFDLVEERDMANDDMDIGTTIGGGVSKGKPWYLPLCPSWNPFTQRFQFNWIGLILTKYILKVMEFVYIAPRGTSKTQIMLQKGGIGLADGGKAEIFTPMYLMVGRVPLNKKGAADTAGEQ
mmetsp:Transcript_37285/g.54899  ORF Transcript_37285/g.54899 Transcript_37285/m.54899 type:complete len:420 (+) Transcript_37285:70-1329(+)